MCPSIGLGAKIGLKGESDSSFCAYDSLARSAILDHMDPKGFHARFGS